jgi:hypothetical protein
MPQAYKLEDGITQSILTRFMECPQKCRYGLDGLYEPSKGENYRKGTIGHAFLEAIYRDPKTDIMALSNRLYEEHKACDKVNQIFGLFQGIIPAYMNYFKSDFKGHSYKPEEMFDVEWNGFRLRGKIDLTYQDKKAFVMAEHKFWSVINEDKMAYILSLDFQANFYAFILNLKTGKYPDRIDYNVIRVPQNKIKDDESADQFGERMKIEINKNPKYYFRRVPVTPSKKQQEDFKGIILRTLNNFKAFIDHTNPYRNYMACNPGIYLCDYASICTSGSKTGFKIKPLFEELT